MAKRLSPLRLSRAVLEDEQAGQGCKPQPCADTVATSCDRHLEKKNAAAGSDRNRQASRDHEANEPNMAGHNPQESSTRGRRWVHAVLFVVLLVLSLRLIAGAVHRHILLTEASPLLYQAAALGFNYFDFGLIRRGLGGSVVWLIGGNLLAATAVFHVLSAAGVAAVVVWFFKRLQTPWPQRLVFALLAIALMMRWAEDAGRTDMAVAALLGLAMIAVVRGRPALAALAVAIGLAVHETSFAYGTALLAGAWLDHGRWRSLKKPAVATASAILVAAIGIYIVLPYLPHADTQTMVEAVRSRLPQHEVVDWAIYFAISGQRGLRAAVCQNALDPAYALHLATGLMVIGVFATLLKDRCGAGWPALLLVSVPPFLFLSIVATDISRWMVLAAFNVWLLAAAGSSEAQRALPDTARSPRAASGWMRIAAAVVVAALIHPKAWRIEDPIFAPTPTIDRLVAELGGPRTTRLVTAPGRCDRAWRGVLDATDKPF